MPRSCSSGSRSVSLPVSARISAVLPWSTCPAVPSVSGASAKRLDNSRGGEARLVVGERPRVEQQPAVASASDDGWIRGSQPSPEFIRTDIAWIHRAHGPIQFEQRKRAATDLGRRTNDT